MSVNVLIAFVLGGLFGWAVGHRAGSNATERVYTRFQSSKEKT